MEQEYIGQITTFNRYICTDYLMFRIRNTIETDGKLPEGKTEEDFWIDYRHIFYNYPRKPNSLSSLKDNFPPDLRAEIQADCTAADKKNPEALDKFNDLNIYCSLLTHRIKPNPYEEIARQLVRKDNEEEIRFQQYIDQHKLEFLHELRQKKWFRHIVTLMEAAYTGDGDEYAADVCCDIIELCDQYRFKNPRWN